MEIYKDNGVPSLRCAGWCVYIGGNEAVCRLQKDDQGVTVCGAGCVDMRAWRGRMVGWGGGLHEHFVTTAFV